MSVVTLFTTLVTNSHHPFQVQPPAEPPTALSHWAPSVGPGRAELAVDGAGLLRRSVGKKRLVWGFRILRLLGFWGLESFGLEMDLKH